METTETKKFSQKLTRWAVGVSVAYAGLLVWLVWVRFDKLPDMELNAIGDFLAGAFSPLAFLWLVVGYFQQGHELSASVAQLERQAKVFEAQREDEADRHRAVSLPKIHVDADPALSAFGQPSSWDIVMTNIGGAACTHFSVMAFDRRFRLDPWSVPQLAPNQFLRASLIWTPGSVPSAGPFRLVIGYVSPQVGSQAELIDMEFYVERDCLYLRKVAPTHPLTKPSNES
ncbi:hypothetical protein ACFQU0_10020 [Hydrogenophaga defluvii]|uniref:Uncharacterized protein n=2 Tax=Hydrogenophaga defluvii TaxID=249410 RepID=A0ABW2SC32_9BURK